MRTIRKERFSILVSFAAAAVTFPIVGLLAGIVVGLIVTGFLDGLSPSPPAYPYDMILVWTSISVIVGIPVMIAYLVSRALYVRVRWETVDNSLGRYCYNCTYDLTGNVSGVCPECGVAVHQDAHVSAEHHQNPSRK